MEQLIQQIITQTGVSKEQAQKAADLTIQFVKDRAGNALQIKLHSAITGEPEETIKDKFEHFAGEAADTFDEIAEKASKKFNEIKDKFSKKKTENK